MTLTAGRMPRIGHRAYRCFNYHPQWRVFTVNIHCHRLRFQSTSGENDSNTDKNMFDHSRQRSSDHQQEILSNEYPDLGSVQHPNANVPSPPSNSAADFYTDESRPKYENYVMPHPIWTEQELNSIHFTHKPPQRFADYMAYMSVFAMRMCWDLSTGYFTGRTLGLHRFPEQRWLLRVVFLETVAGVPGFMFAMVRHMKSLRTLERDRGWIKSLLTEAENERIHLLTAMHLYKPGKLLRYAIVIAQGIMSNCLFLVYLLSPRFCHSFVGYLEEQAVHTYTNLLSDIDAGKLPKFEQPCSTLAREYWRLAENATWRDVFANIRADEGHHRDINHDLADICDNPQAVNPYRREGLEPTDQSKDENKKSNN
eukprot:CAMPEP_0202703522 /NCGR_PEP_ID=MMETSP1385-20130828/16364_1 /ASSEMBLY_ACC=CAM_ASM_000861 /TAXON_ID=933848 /ORGANISM="Elphidium margaritaceum" /LENGTH=367 /DNA_ID=CAMNT_0049361393 /DNA_START=21 /DNA_END=1124 /DNA_ORIENTATION=-